MRIKKHLPTLFALTAVLTLGVSLYANVNKTPVTTEVNAEQVNNNFAPYTYSGSYYSDIDFNAGDGMTGSLREAITTLIYPKGWYTYSGSGADHLSTQLQYADEDPTNSSNMIYFYTRDSVKKNAASTWNREHVWPQSLSNNNYGTGSGAGSDLLHIRPTYNSTNGKRGSLLMADVGKQGADKYEGMVYGYFSDGKFEPLDSVKGDVARIFMYVWTAYYKAYNHTLNILKAIESYDTLLKWHTMDKPDALEGYRNDYSESSKQKNRNPFVDHPELAWKIFGDNASSTVKANCMAAYPAGGGTPIDPTGITINKSTATVEVGKSVQLNASLKPSGATGTITWSSSNSLVATVNNGKVTGVSSGTAVIKATCGNYSASCTVTVEESVPVNYGTKENPISVTEAKTIIDNESPTQEMIYVKGVVASSTYNTNFSNFDDVYLKDGNDDKALSLFRSVLGNGVDTKYNTSGELVGKEVVACGYGEYYTSKSKYELSPQNNTVPTIISVKEPGSQEKTAKELVEEKTTSTSLAYHYKKTTNGEGSVTDTLTNSNTIANITTNYTDWTFDKTNSGVIYKGQSAGDKGAIQLRTKNSNSGIVVTSNTDGSKAAKVSVVWNSGTSSGRTLEIYGKNAAYNSPSDLYGASNQGTLLGTIAYGTSTSLTINGDYKFIGFKSKDSALYLDSLDVEWGASVSTYEYSNVSIRFGGTIEKDLWSKLDTESSIIGFGVMITDGKYINSDDDFMEAISDAVSSSVSTNLTENIAINYFIPVENLDTVMGVEKDNYFWNLRQSVSDLKAEYAAAAYIKTNDGNVFFKYENYSAQTLAADYIYSRGYSATSYSGSLANLATIK